MKYRDIKTFNPTMTECFFAFNNQQFEEGRIKIRRTGNDAKIIRFGSGLFGTESGLNQFESELAAHHKQIMDNCDPQDVYEYEFVNHECGYTYDDIPALDIVNKYFPVAAVKRFPKELMEDI